MRYLVLAGILFAASLAWQVKAIANLQGVSRDLEVFEKPAMDKVQLNQSPSPEEETAFHRALDLRKRLYNTVQSLMYFQIALVGCTFGLLVLWRQDTKKKLARPPAPLAAEDDSR